MNQPVTELSQTPMKEDSPKEYAVKDIYMAAYLMALGHKLDYARSDGYQAEFFFKSVPSSDFLCYYNGDVHPKLSARNLFDAFQNARRVSRQIRVVPSTTGMDDE